MTYDDDASYVQDLGLIAKGNPVRIASPVYQEIIARVLGASAERVITANPRAILLPDGKLDLNKLLEAFASFWKENGDVLAGSMPYHEVAPQKVWRRGKRDPRGEGLSQAITPANRTVTVIRV